MFTPSGKEKYGGRHGQTPRSPTMLQGHINKLARNQISTLQMMGIQRYKNGLGRQLASTTKVAVVVKHF